MARTRLTFDEFLRRANIAHDNKYDYSLTQLTIQHANIDVICPIHGVFKVTAANHIKNFDGSWSNTSAKPCGCGECGKEFTRQRNKAGSDTKDEFVAKANNVHNSRYTYPGEYMGQNFKLDIECPAHGVFQQTAGNHLRGRGCPRCKNSSGATMIAKCLTRLGLEYSQEHMFPDCYGDSHPLRFDFWIPSLNTLIEYDGEHHFQPIRFRGASAEKVEEAYQRGQRYDAIKTAYAADHEIKLIRIPYYSKHKIKEILSSALCL